MLCFCLNYRACCLDQNGTQSGNIAIFKTETETILEYLSFSLPTIFCHFSFNKNHIIKNLIKSAEILFYKKHGTIMQVFLSLAKCLMSINYGKLLNFLKFPIRIRGNCLYSFVHLCIFKA